jgi:hypothetical protein
MARDSRARSFVAASRRCCEQESMIAWLLLAGFFLLLSACGHAIHAMGSSVTPNVASAASVGAGTGSAARHSPTSLPPADDIPETGLQGQVPLADQLSGKSAAGYRKGLRLVGQNTIMNRGANFSLAWIGDCAYVTTSSIPQTFGIATNPTGLPLSNPLNGMAVIDASDPTNPALVSILQSPAMIAPHESLRTSELRKIIVSTLVGGDAMDVYDASDCRHPVLKSSITIPGFGGHALCLTDDGKTAYPTSLYNGSIGSVAVDLTDLANPKVLTTTGSNLHDCGLNEDGSRLYYALQPPSSTINQPQGLLIFDSTEFKNGAANPQLKQIGSLMWTAGSESEMDTFIGSSSHTARLFRQPGHSYLYSSDETPLVGECPWGHGRIIDITDETAPKKISDLTLEVQLKANCPMVIPDDANYSSHYVGFDDPENATVIFESSYTSGLRVWDIHDPAHPKEIAYWHPAPIINSALLSTGSQIALSNAPLWDSVPNYVRYRPESGQIWLIGYTAGFQILQFTQSAGPTAPLPTGG